MDFEQVFGTNKPVVGMVHLQPLPGSPRSDGDLDAVLERARADARALDTGGVDGVIVENFGDAPFYPDAVPAHTVAAMTRATDAVRRAVDVPVGVNVLRNDAEAALSVAAAAGAAFVRVNVHTGVRLTDQGVLEGQAHETLRLRERLGADVDVFADLAVKHSTPLTGADDDVGTLTETVERGLADAVVVSGTETGAPVDAGRLETVLDERAAAGLATPVLVGSGVGPESVEDLLVDADGVVVGTALKAGGETTAPVDSQRVTDLVAAADRVR